MKRSFLKSALIIAAMMILPALSIFRLNAQDLKTATLLTRSEAYDKAAEMFKQLIQKEPGNSKNYFFYGENWLQDYFSDTLSNSLADFTREAKALYDKGVSTNPNEPLNYVGLARVAFYNKDYKKADEMRAKARSFLLPYKNYKKMTPPAKDYAYILAKLSESYITVTFKVDTAKALPLMREALKIDSKNPDIYLIAGDIFNLKNDGSNAIKNYNLAQEYDPKSPTANMKIGSIYVRAKNLQAAIPPFEQAISLDANYAPAYRELAALYLMARRYDDAKRNFEKYLELTQGNIPAKISYVRSLYFAGEYDEVIKNIEEIFTVDQSKPYLNRLAAYSCYDKKDADYDKALSYIEALFQKASPSTIIQRDYLYFARILLGKNQNYPTLVRDRDRMQVQADREKTKYNSASAADKAKYKPGLDTANAKVARIKKQIEAADKELDRAFTEFDKALHFNAETQADIALLTEIANNYYKFRRYEQAAKTWAKVIALGKNETKDYMQLGRWYYTGEKYKAVDSVCNFIIKKDPKYLDAYLYLARSASKQEADPKEGLARTKFEKVIDIALADSVKNGDEIIESYNYLGYHYLQNNNYSKAREYYMKMISLDPKSKEFRIRGYNSLANLEYTLSTNEKAYDVKIPYVNKAIEWYNKIIEIDPNNEPAKASIKNFTAYRINLEKGINPNELKGTVKNSAGSPIANASIRVKDTAAETYSNAAGAFKFEIPQSSEALIISASGYKSKELPVTRPLRALNVVLEQ